MIQILLTLSMILDNAKYRTLIINHLNLMIKKLQILKKDFVQISMKQINNFIKLKMAIQIILIEQVFLLKLINATIIQNAIQMNQYRSY